MLHFERRYPQRRCGPLRLRHLCSETSGHSVKSSSSLHCSYLGKYSASQRVKAPNGQSNWYNFSRHSRTSRTGPLRSAFCRRMLLSKPIRGLPRIGQHIEVLCGSSRTSGWRTALVVRNDAAKRRSIIKWSDGELFRLCPDVPEQKWRNLNGPHRCWG